MIGDETLEVGPGSARPSPLRTSSELPLLPPLLLLLLLLPLLPALRLVAGVAAEALAPAAAGDFMGFPAGPDTPAHTMINPSSNTEDLVYLMVGDRPKPGVRSPLPAARKPCSAGGAWMYSLTSQVLGHAQDTDIVDYPNVNVRMFRWVTRDGTEGRQSVPVRAAMHFCCLHVGFRLAAGFGRRSTRRTRALAALSYDLPRRVCIPVCPCGAAPCYVRGLCDGMSGPYLSVRSCLRAEQSSGALLLFSHQ